VIATGFPFALSLSKGSRRERIARDGQGFDTLSPNGFGEKL
jgi:hypothetical protein